MQVKIIALMLGWIMFCLREINGIFPGYKENWVC